MRILLSPAKQMRQDLDVQAPSGLPVFLPETEKILSVLRSKSYDELKQIWNCSDRLAEENFCRLKDICLTEQLTPAILSYVGLAYQHMAPAVFEKEELSYVQDHLRILSAFYGVLKPMDGIVPYRLEMQAVMPVGNAGDLYAFWGDKLYREALDDSRSIINLASREYASAVEPYLQTGDRYITVDFVEKTGGKLITKGTYAKMARGEMVRFMAENRIEDPEKLKKFHELGYEFKEDLSSDQVYLFERIGEKTPGKSDRGF